MLRRLETYELEQGGTVSVEVDASPAEIERISSGRDRIVTTGRQFTEALQTAQKAASEAVAAFSEALKPDELELSFGIKLAAAAGVIITSASSEANFQLKAKWVRKPD